MAVEAARFSLEHSAESNSMRTCNGWPMKQLVRAQARTRELGMRSGVRECGGRTRLAQRTWVTPSGIVSVPKSARLRPLGAEGPGLGDSGRIRRP